MPFTDEERALIESLVTKCLALQQALNTLVAQVDINTEWIINYEPPPTIQTLSPSDIKELIRKPVGELIRGTAIKIHTHLSDQSGGPAFAKKGAALITATETEETP